MSAALRTPEREALWRHGVIAPWYLRESQKDCYAVLVKHKDPFLECARRFGKTTTTLVYVSERLIQKPGSVCTWGEPNKNQAREIVMPEVSKVFETCPGYLKPKYYTTDSMYVFPNESKIKLRGINEDGGDSARGSASDIIVADEYGFWRHARYVVSSVLMPQLLTTDGQFITMSTPPEDLDHDYYVSKDFAMRDGRYIKKTIYDNESLSPEQIEEAARSVGGKDSVAWKREFLCEAISDPERLVIPEYSDSVHDVDDDFPRPSYYSPYVGVDLGFNDNTFAVFGYFDFIRNALVIEEEFCVAGKDSKFISEACKAIEEKLWPDLRPLRYSDNDLQQLHDMGTLHGYSMTPTEKNNRDTAINALRVRFSERRILIKKRCKLLRNQLRVGLWKENRRDFQRGETTGHLDGIMALVYLNRNINEKLNPYPRYPENYHPSTHFISEDLLKPRGHKELANAFMPYGRKS